LGLSYLTRGVGTLLMALDFSNAYAYYAVVALAIGPTFGTVAVGNFLFYELVGPRMAGMILGMSFIMHQIGSAAGPMVASITYDRTGSYDGFMVVMSLVLLASGLALFRESKIDAITVETVPLGSPSTS
jgi:predicted MFS family arabinose efflux permease